MNLQENILRIREVMGLLVEDKKRSDAPHGVIFFGNNKVLVGDFHQTPHELSNELVKKIIQIGDKYGYFGEGIGIEHNDAVLKGPVYANSEKLKNGEMYKGSWDDIFVSKFKGDQKDFLITLFSNPKENKRKENLLSKVKKGDSILDVLDRTKYDWSPAQKVSKEELEQFLSDVSQGEIDLLNLSKNEATEENIEDFLNKGESLTWPKDWREYKTNAGKVAKRFNDARNIWLINSGPGVYFVGSGHLHDIVNMPEGKELKLIGGEDI